MTVLIGYVPTPVGEQPRVYQSPPRRLGSWSNDRPGDFVGRQPVGPGLGSPGPDQGYVLKLARQFEEDPSVRYGMTTMCIGLGMGATVIWENPHHEHYGQDAA